MEVSLALAFAAGVASFITPCVLALVPVYVAVLSESSLHRSGSTRLLPGAVGFVLGFSAVFVLLGVSVGIVGAALFREPIVRQLAGMVVIGIGLLMTGLFGPVLDRLPNPLPSRTVPAPGQTRSVVLGALVAIGWTPCIGPVLGAILAMGASTQDVAVAALLLIAYTAGLAVPFLAAAAFLPRATGLLRWLRSHERPIRIASGLGVAAIGVLIVLDAFTWLAGLFGGFFL